MNISHLTHTAEGVVRCKCGYEFEVSRRELSEPQRLVERKEKIAAEHRCNLEPRKAAPVHIKVWRHPVGGAQLNHYYSQAMRRQMSA
jgi:hypothetical protein